MPAELAMHVPSQNTTLLSEIYGDIMTIAERPTDDPIRLGAITAYQNVM